LNCNELPLAQQLTCWAFKLCGCKKQLNYTQQFGISPSVLEELTRAVIHFSLVFILAMKKNK